MTVRSKPTGQEIDEASSRMGDFSHRTETAGAWDKIAGDDLAEMSKLVKITGRRKMIYGGPNYNFQGTAGKLLDRMNHSVGINLPSAGKLPELTPSAPTAIAMAKKLALYTGGTYTWNRRRCGILLGFWGDRGIVFVLTIRSSPIDWPNVAL